MFELLDSRAHAPLLLGEPELQSCGDNGSDQQKQADEDEDNHESSSRACYHQSPVPHRESVKVTHGKPPRVAIVGAGAAGLASARALREVGFEHDVYEASDRVGGL